MAAAKSTSLGKKAIREKREETTARLIDAYKNDPIFVEEVVMELLDEMSQYRSTGNQHMAQAVYNAIRDLRFERGYSVGHALALGSCTNAFIALGEKAPDLAAHLHSLQDDEGKTPLCLIIDEDSADNQSVLRAALKSGGFRHILTRDNSYYSALDWAMLNESGPMVHELLSAAPDPKSVVNATDPTTGKNALHAAVYYPDYKMDTAIPLVLAGIDLRAQTVSNPELGSPAELSGRTVASMLRNEGSVGHATKAAQIDAVANEEPLAAAILLGATGQQIDDAISGRYLVLPVGNLKAFFDNVRAHPLFRKEDDEFLTVIQRRIEVVRDRMKGRLRTDARLGPELRDRLAVMHLLNARGMVTEDPDLKLPPEMIERISLGSLRASFTHVVL